MKRANHKLGRFPMAALVLGLMTAGCGGRVVPPERLTGRWHRVQPGQSLDDISQRYGVEAEVIAELNDLPDGRLARRGEIFVPTRDGRAPGEWPSTKTSKTESPSAKASREKKAKHPAAKDKISARGACPQKNEDCLVWPVEGQVVAVFGPGQDSHHDGLDIAAPGGTDIAAAAAGVVIYSGDDIQGYGNLVILRHDRGLITVYAHNAKNLVIEGQKVEKGQIIAAVGSTGAATRDHLHFEVRTREKPRDPLPLLPARP